MQIKIGALVGLCVIGVGGLLLIIGVATPEWIKTDWSKFGLWKVCDTVSDECSNISDEAINDAFRAVRAFAVLALLASIACGGCALFHVVMGMLERGSHKMLPLLCVGFGIASLVFSLIAVIIWGVDKDIVGRRIPSDLLGYSFYLTVIGGAFTAAGSIVVFIVDKA